MVMERENRHTRFMHMCVCGRRYLHTYNGYNSVQLITYMHYCLCGGRTEAVGHREDFNWNSPSDKVMHILHCKCTESPFDFIGHSIRCLLQCYNGGVYCPKATLPRNSSSASYTLTKAIWVQKSQIFHAFSSILKWESLWFRNVYLALWTDRLLAKRMLSMIPEAGRECQQSQPTGPDSRSPALLCSAFFSSHPHSGSCDGRTPTRSSNTPTRRHCQQGPRDRHH